MDDLPEELRPLVDVMARAAFAREMLGDNLELEPSAIKEYWEGEAISAIQAALRAGWTFTPPGANTGAVLAGDMRGHIPENMNYAGQPAGQGQQAGPLAGQRNPTKPQQNTMDAALRRSVTIIGKDAPPKGDGNDG